MSASVNLPLHHEVQKFSSGTGSPRWSGKKGHKTVVCACVSVMNPVLSEIELKLECGPMPNVMVALPNAAGVTLPRCKTR